MKQIEWENILLKNLTSLGDEERFKIAEYYREMYADKLEAGVTSDEILAEFGSPEECAQKILQEAGKDGEETKADAVEETEKVEATAVTPKQSVLKKSIQKWTPSMIVGMAFLTLLVILPLAGGAVGVMAAFAAVCVSGSAMALAGGVYSIASLFFGAIGMNTGSVLAHCGMGIAAVGVGFLLCVGFYYATKYTVIACWKALRWIYKRGE